MLIGVLLGAAPACAALAQPMSAPSITDPARRQALVRIVRQDCGSCHGMHLNGGLGPALTAQALAGIPFDAVLASIEHGRPGTPMPGWKSLLSNADARWIAQQLKAGFPQESKAGR